MYYDYIHYVPIKMSPLCLATALKYTNLFR